MDDGGVGQTLGPLIEEPGFGQQLERVAAAMSGGRAADRTGREDHSSARAWAVRNKVELCLTPTSASWANPIEAHFGPLRTFTMGASNHSNHPTLARRLQAYLRWRNTHARHPDVLAAQRRERARIRSERHQRWGRSRVA